MIKQAIEKVVNHENLTFEESEAVLDEIMNGEASEVQTASLLTALTAKNPTIDRRCSCFYEKPRACFSRNQGSA